MDENVREERYRLFLTHGIDVALQHTKTLVTLFSGIIAGLIALVVYKSVGFWPGVMFLLADGFAVMGLGFCILHMSYTAKVLYLTAEHYNVKSDTPDVVSEDPGGVKDELAAKFYIVSAQRCYSNQLWFLFFSASSAAVGVACLLWPQIKAAGLVLSVAVLVVGLLFGGFVFWYRKKASRQTDSEGA